MEVIVDSTVIFHLYYHQAKMKSIIFDLGIKTIFTTSVNSLEILAGAASNAKRETRKHLAHFGIIEFDQKAQKVAEKLAYKYQVSSKNQRDLLIASICIGNKMPLLSENVKDFQFEELKLLKYRIFEQ